MPAVLQLRINEFSRLNSRKAEQKKEVEKLQKSLQDLDDASEGVLLGDGNPGDVKIMHGESFFNIDADAANAYIDATKEVCRAVVGGRGGRAVHLVRCLPLAADDPGEAPGHPGGPCGHRGPPTRAEEPPLCPARGRDQPGGESRPVAVGGRGGREGGLRLRSRPGGAALGGCQRATTCVGARPAGSGVSSAGGDPLRGPSSRHCPTAAGSSYLSLLQQNRMRRCCKGGSERLRAPRGL